jgi:putative membrane protein
MGNLNKTPLAMVGAALLLAAAAFAADQGTVPAADRSFVMEAAHGGQAEVELGKLAAGKAVNPDVKSFAQKMADDHSKANDKLRQVASEKGLSLPSDLDQKSRAEYNHLEKLAGAAFDRAYVKLMVKDHVKDVAEFQRESEKAADPAIRQFVTETLPTLQEHLSMAKDLQSKVMAPAGAGSRRGSRR